MPHQLAGSGVHDAALRSCHLGTRWLTTSSDEASPSFLSSMTSTACVSRTAERVLKRGVAMGAFDRRSEELANFRHGLLIRGSLVRTHLREPRRPQTKEPPRTLPVAFLMSSAASCSIPLSGLWPAVE